MRARDMRDAWAMAGEIPPARLAGLGAPHHAANLVRRDLVTAPASCTGTVEPGQDLWLVAVRGRGDGVIEADDPSRLVRDGPILDLLRFDPLKPERWHLARGAVTALGAIEPQYLDPRPVHIHETPLDWLRASGNGLVLLTSDWREQRNTLMSCRGGIAATDPNFGVRLRETMTRPILEPRIYVVKRIEA